jgi:hypothetical protein
MDFSTLKQSGREAIFNRYKIPLPLISKETMTMANLEASNVILLHNAVLPVADAIFSYLSYALLPRYKESSNKNLKITYDKSDIPALEALRTKNIDTKAKTGIYSLNELREQDGAEAVSGGNAYYRPLSDQVIAIGETEKSKELAIADAKTEQSNCLSKEDFIEKLKRYDFQGQRIFSDQEIKIFGDQYDL